MNTLPAHLDIPLPSLVRDYILYGEDDIDEFLHLYKLTIEEFKLLRQLPEFASIAKTVQNEVNSKGKVQIKARTLMETHLMTLHDVIENTTYEASDRIKAMDLLARLADALPKNNTPTNTGLNVSINFGGSVKPAALPADIIEAANG